MNWSSNCKVLIWHVYGMSLNHSDSEADHPEKNFNCGSRPMMLCMMDRTGSQSFQTPNFSEQDDLAIFLGESTATTLRMFWRTAATPALLSCRLLPSNAISRQQDSAAMSSNGGCSGDEAPPRGGRTVVSMVEGAVATCKKNTKGPTVVKSRYDGRIEIFCTLLCHKSKSSE